jgi:hypothetical protein
MAHGVRFTTFSFSAPRFTAEDLATEFASFDENVKTQIREDIHGHRAIRLETADFLQNCLAEFAAAMEAIPESTKEVYMQAMDIAPALVDVESSPIQFLRAASFDAKV